MAKTLIIQNPVAGTKPTEKVSQKIRDFFGEHGWEYHIHQTKEGENISELITSSISEGYDCFIAAGGDGTISAVASGLTGHKIPLGILPVGTGNGLARDLKIPMNLDKAMNLILTKHAVNYIDAMEVNGKYFLLNLTVGFTPMALEMTDREQKHKLGRFAYFLAGFRSLFGIQPISFFLKIDDTEMDFRASEVILMNSVTIGDPGRYLNLGIENDDGILDLFIIKSKTIRDYFRVFMNLIFRNPTRDPDVERFKIKERLRISGKKLLQVQADGDLIGYTPVEVNLVQRAVGIIVPE